MLTFLRDELDGKARTNQTTDRHFLNKLFVFSRQLEYISFRLHNFSTAARPSYAEYELTLGNPWMKLPFLFAAREKNYCNEFNIFQHS